MIDELDPLIAQLRRVRLEQGRTMAQVCIAMRVNRNYLQALEHGKRSPTLSTLRRWCAALGVDLCARTDDQRRRRP